MKTAFTLALCASLVAGAALAQTAPVTPAPAIDAAGVYQVYRTTDNQLSCEQIISELNLLNSQIKAQADAQAAAQMAAQQKAAQVAAAPPPAAKRGGFGGLLGAAASSGLAGAIPGIGGLARNPLAAQAAMAAANAASQSAANASANQQAAAMAQQQAAAQAAMAAANQPQSASQSNEAQRLGRIRGLMTSKGC